MQELTMGVIEARFADMIWQNEPISSGILCKMAENELGWRKSTAFTVLKRLCDKGVFTNEKGIVTSCFSKAEFASMQSERFVEDTFHGSLPAFLAAFIKRKALSAEEVEELKKLIDKYGGT